MSDSVELLRICSTFLVELQKVREEIKELDGRVKSISTRIDRLEEQKISAPIAGGGPAEQPDTVELELRELCFVGQTPLGELLVAGCARGNFWFELGSLASSASSRGIPRKVLRDTILEELRRGALRGSVYRVYDVEGSLKLEAHNAMEVVEAAVAEELSEAKGGASGVVVLKPMFRQSSWPLLLAMSRWCSQEWLVPVLDVLLVAMKSVLTEGHDYRDTDLLAMFSSAPQGIALSVTTTASGQTAININEGRQDSMHPPVPLFTIGDEVKMNQKAAAGDADSTEVVTAASALATQLDSLTKGGSTSSIGVDDFDVVAALRHPRIQTALQLPASLASLRVGAFLWAANCRSKVPSWSPTVPLPSAGNAEANGVASAADPDSTEEKGEKQSPCSQLFLLEQQARFIDCFWEELCSKRLLLLSQLNNLYKMRGGEELQYKTCGFEKLRDFLSEIPGLSLTGRGNHMQVSLEDLAALTEFKRRVEAARAEASTGEGGSSPKFMMPQAIPDRIKRKIHDLFLGAEGHEIPMRGFLSAWAARYKEVLDYRALGFRDVRGLLAQVDFLTKEGSKQDAKYVLINPGEEGGATDQAGGGGAATAAPGLAVGPVVVGTSDLATAGLLPRIDLPPGLGGFGSTAGGSESELRGPVFLQESQGGGVQPQLEAPAAGAAAAATRVKRDRPKKIASLFVSSPGALSSDVRDASASQHKFDKSTTLQMHVRRDAPCVVCDISTGKVMAVNTECEDLFESEAANMHMLSMSIYQLMHLEDRDQFTATVTAATSSGRMDPHEVRIMTLLGKTRIVRIEGSQLQGMWWSFSLNWHV